MKQTIQLAFALALFASTALAEPSPGDRAAATALFEQGRKLMEQHAYDAACAKLAESQRLDPGGGTLLNLATCHELEGKTATAWSEFTEALGIARVDGRQDRVKYANEHIAALEPKLARLVIVVGPEAELTGLEIRRDGARVGRAAWGTAIPVDPGAHALAASAPGHADWNTTITVGEAQQESVAIPPLEAVAPPPAPQPAASPAPPVMVEPPRGATAPPRQDHPPPRAGLSVPGVLVTAAGVLGVGIGSYFGVRAISKRHQSDDECAHGCTDEGVRLNDQAKTAADISTVAFVAGGIGLAVGGYLLVTDSGATATRGRNVGLSLRARW